MTAANAQKVVYPQNVGTLTTGLANRTGTTQDSLYVVAGTQQKPLTPITTADKAHGGAENGCSWQGLQTSPTLTANNAGGGQRMPDKDNFTCVIVGMDSYNQTITGNKTMPLRAASGGDTSQKVIIVEKGNRN